MDRPEYVLKETPRKKILRSPSVNYVFDKSDGTMCSWGRTPETDFAFSPFGPFLADIEVTTICDGLPGRGPCDFCYKSNRSEGRNMPPALFRKILDALPPVLTQVALGADAACAANPEIWSMMDYCREKGVVPNITVAALDEETAARLAQRTGACAVSHYGDFPLLLNAVRLLARHKAGSEATLKQINVHQLLAEETLDSTYHLLEGFDAELRGMVHAVVFLSLKQRGRGRRLTPLDQAGFTRIVRTALERNIPLGFDSCAAPKVVRAYCDLGITPPLDQISSCESACESLYCNVDGRFFPCSFTEDGAGIPVPEPGDFLRDVWFHPTQAAFRAKILAGRNARGIGHCPTYAV
jgi:hypothetical protein